MNTVAPKPERWTQKEIAYEFGVDVRTVYNWRKTLGIKPVSVDGNVLLFDPPSVKAAHEQHILIRISKAA